MSLPSNSGNVTPDVTIDTLKATIQRVRDLHRKRTDAPQCMGCWDSYPCRTIRALDGEQG